MNGIKADDGVGITCITVQHNLKGTTRVYFGSEGGKVRMWDLGCKSIFYFRDHVAALKTRELRISKILLVDDLLVASSHDWVVRVWDTKTGARLRADRGHQREVTNMVVLWGSEARYDTLITGSNDCTMIAWRFIDEGGANSPRGTARMEGTIRRASRQQTYHQRERRMKRVREFQADDPVTCLAAVDRHRFAAAYNSGTVDVWTITHRRGEGRQFRFYNHTQPITSLLAVPGTEYVKLYAGSYKLVLQWKLDVRFRDQAPVKFSGHESFVSALAYGRQQGLLITSSFDGTARTWDDEHHTAKLHFRSAKAPDFATPTMHFLIMVFQMTSFPLSKQLPWSRVAEPARIVFNAGIFQLELDIPIEAFLVQFWTVVAFVLCAFLLLASRDVIFFNQFASKNTVSSAGQSSFEKNVRRVQKFLMMWVYVASMSAYLPCVKTLFNVFDCTNVGGRLFWDRALHTQELTLQEMLNGTDRLSTGADALLTPGVLEYECFGAVHLPCFIVASLIIIPYLFFATRLALCRGVVRAVVNVFKPRLDAGKGVAESCWMGALTRRSNSAVVDISVLVANTLLSATAILFTSQPVGLSWMFLVCSSVVWAVTLWRRPYYGARANLAMMCGRFLFFWTCLCGVLTAMIDDELNDIPGYMLWIGYASVAGFFVFYILMYQLYLKVCKKSRRRVFEPVTDRRLKLKKAAAKVQKQLAVTRGTPGKRGSMSEQTAMQMLQLQAARAGASSPRVSVSDMHAPPSAMADGLGRFGSHGGSGLGAGAAGSFAGAPPAAAGYHGSSAMSDIGSLVDEVLSSDSDSELAYHAHMAMEEATAAAEPADVRVSVANQRRTSL